MFILPLRPSTRTLTLKFLSKTPTFSSSPNPTHPISTNPPTLIVTRYPQCSCASQLVTSNDLHPLQLLDLPLNLRLRHHRFFNVAIPRKSGFVGEAVIGAVRENPSASLGVSQIDESLKMIAESLILRSTMRILVSPPT
ncbi:hypothetical protein ACFX1W_030409 [Malus domestica]